MRASFYRKLFIAFVAAAVVPVLALAFVTRAYIATLMQADLEMEATRTAASASRVVEDVGTLEAADGTARGVVDDDLVVWLSRVIAQDVNIFDGSGLLASSERNLFASGLLPTRTQGEVYRAIVLDGRPSYRRHAKRSARTRYLVAAAPVRVQNRDAILTVPLTLRQQEIEAQIDELDRRVLLAAVLFIMLGAVIGYSMAERIADPVNRLMKATGRIARGDLDARILATSSDEFRRLVEAFNRMAADLQRQRVELERTNRLAAWADMARQVAHDIKNPLTPIQLNAEHLRRVHEDRGDAARPRARRVRRQHPDAGAAAAADRQRVLELRVVADGAAGADVAARADRGSGRAVPDGSRGPGGDRDGRAARRCRSLMVDKDVLARALTNIIENALHAMPGGGTLQHRARRRRPDSASSCRSSIPASAWIAASLDRIFEPYFSTRAQRHRPRADHRQAQRRAQWRHDRGRERDAARARRSDHPADGSVRRIKLEELRRGSRRSACRGSASRRRELVQRQIDETRREVAVGHDQQHFVRDRSRSARAARRAESGSDSGAARRGRSS